MNDKLILPGTPEFYAALGETTPDDLETVEESARYIRAKHYDDMDTKSDEYLEKLNAELDADAMMNGEAMWKRLKIKWPLFYKGFREAIIGLPADSELWRPLQFELAGKIRDDLDAGHIIGYLHAHPIKRGFWEKTRRLFTKNKD
jgi:hypothetical protein